MFCHKADTVYGYMHCHFVDQFGFDICLSESPYPVFVKHLLWLCTKWGSTVELTRSGYQKHVHLERLRKVTHVALHYLAFCKL